MKSLRCNNCRKKLGMMEFKCKCELKFCSSCIQPKNTIVHLIIEHKKLIN